jgi:hypothetical protein
LTTAAAGSIGSNELSRKGVNEIEVLRLIRQHRRELTMDGHNDANATRDLGASEQIRLKGSGLLI